MVLYPDFFNIQGEESVARMKAMRYSFVSVGIWWIVFSQYTFFYLPKGVSKGHKVTKSVLLNGYKELNSVWNELRSSIKLKRFLNAFFIYSMAVQTIMLMAVYFGTEEIEWASENQKTIGLIISILLIQIVGVFGAFATSRASKRFGNINTLIVINFIWMLICFYAFFVETPFHFYIVGAKVGFVMGGVQALSRSTYSKFLPKTEDTTSYFSFYDVTEKIGIVIGMIIYGFVNQITGTMRNAILFLFVFFLLGIVLLFRIPRNKIIN